MITKCSEIRHLLISLHEKGSYFEIYDYRFVLSFKKLIFGIITRLNICVRGVRNPEIKKTCLVPLPR
jgi:hypothetical protein